MKTAISLEEDLLSQADRAAQQMGVSRSRLVPANTVDAIRSGLQLLFDRV